MLLCTEMAVPLPGRSCAPDSSRGVQLRRGLPYFLGFYKALHLDKASKVSTLHLFSDCCRTPYTEL